MSKKTLFRILRIIIAIGGWTAGIYLLYRYEYFVAVSALDNITGTIPVALILLFAGGLSVLAVIDFNKKNAPLAVCLAVVIIISAALFPNSLRGNWWFFDGSYDTSGSEADISPYQPFKENNLTAKLQQPSELVLNKDLPVLDGALALYPLYSAFAECVYDREAFTTSQCFMFTNTLRAYDGIIAGERDVIFAAGASENQLKKAQSAGAELVFTPIGKEAFVFIAGADNPVDNLTIQQIRNVYSGKTAKWSTLGWKEGGDILAFQRPEGSGSQTGLQSVMKGLPIISPQPLPDECLDGTNSLMQKMSVKVHGVQPALGYSYRYFAQTMYANPQTKLLKVNGVYPSSENVKNGSYPFTANFYAVTNGQPAGNTARLIEWILSPQGQSIVEKTGYVPL